MNDQINIILVDDHKILLDGLEALLSINDTFSVIGKYTSGIDLINTMGYSEADVIIMDINMADADGLEVLRRINQLGYQGKCILLSSYDDLKLVNEAITLGACGYVTKASATEFLEEAIEYVLIGDQYFSPDVKDKILSSFGNKKVEETTNEPGLLRLLTDRELEVLVLIAQQMTSDEIAKKLYIAKSTVDTHRKNLITKLNVKNSVGLGLFAKKFELV